MSPPQYKLVYFDARGVAETARFIFAYANIPYEDVRVKHEEWPELKPKTPFGQLPYLEVNGKPYAQSVAFTRLLAKKYKLAGTSDEEQAQVDAIVDYMKGRRIPKSNFIVSGVLRMRNYIAVSQ